MIDILIAIGLFGFIIIYIFLFVCFIYWSRKENKNGSKLTIGKGEFTLTVMNVDQHFNWFQKKMWKFLLGIKVEDYSEED